DRPSSRPGAERHPAHGAPLGRRSPARPRLVPSAAGQAGREPALQRRYAARGREPQSRFARELVRDGAARGCRSILRATVDKGLRCRVGARPARRGANGSPPRFARGVQAEAERRVGAGRVSADRTGPVTVGQAGRRGRLFASPQDAAECGLAQRSRVAGTRGRRAGGDRPSAQRSRRGARARRVRGARRGAAVTVTGAAPAKGNLALGVGPLRTDGKHEVLTVLQRLELADRITVEPADTLTVEGFAEDTLVASALSALDAPHAWRATIEKQIPVASGLGGGSSD